MLIDTEEMFWVQYKFNTSVTCAVEYQRKQLWHASQFVKTSCSVMEIYRALQRDINHNICKVQPQDLLIMGVIIRLDW